MLKVARKNIRGMGFLKGDMMDFNINKEFDVITCLFSTIAYAKNYRNLKKVLKNFSSHMKKGGVLIIEPWFDKSNFVEGHAHMTTYDGDGIKIARVGFSKIRGDTSIIYNEYLIVEENKGIKHLKDNYEEPLFERKKFLELMRESGLKPVFRRKGLSERGLYIGIKK